MSAPTNVCEFVSCNVIQQSRAYRPDRRQPAKRYFARTERKTDSRRSAFSSVGRTAQVPGAFEWIGRGGRRRNLSTGRHSRGARTTTAVYDDDITPFLHRYDRWTVYTYIVLWRALRPLAESPERFLNPNIRPWRTTRWHRSSRLVYPPAQTRIRDGRTPLRVCSPPCGNVVAVPVHLVHFSDGGDALAG